MNRTETKLRGGRYWVPVVINEEYGDYVFRWDFIAGWRELKDHLKRMGARWNSGDKTWRLPIDPRVQWQLNFLRRPPSPYNLYDKRESFPLREQRLPFFEHQIEFYECILTRRRMIIAGEMGVAKTLPVLAAMEWAIKYEGLKEEEILYVAPKNVLAQIEEELYDWAFQFTPRLISYDQMRRDVNHWAGNAPKFVVFDESSRLKNPGSQRSIAALHISHSMLEEYGPKGFVVLMSGSPSPTAPVDWWHQAEVARPGFIVEGNINKLKQTLAIVEMRENQMTGGKYPHFITWKDDALKCDKCGGLEEDEYHNMEMACFGQGKVHVYKPSVNEIDRLYKRLQGLVIVKFKDECMNLPKAVHVIERLTAPTEMLNAAKLVAAKATSIIVGLTKLRSLSDGFQYRKEKIGEEKCNVCGGTGNILTRFDPEKPDEQLTQAQLEAGRCLEERIDCCEKCWGEGVIDVERRHTKAFDTPKDAAVLKTLRYHEPIGRFVLYAAFTGSVNKCVDMCVNEGWAVIRVDGRGWLGFGIAGNARGMLRQFRRKMGGPAKIVFIAQPGAAGMGLNLCASPSIGFYSNSYNFEDRIQAADRCRRPGIEETMERMEKLGMKAELRIYDWLLLPSCNKVLENLTNKRRLQGMTLGVLQEGLVGGEIIR